MPVRAAPDAAREQEGGLELLLDALGNQRGQPDQPDPAEHEGGGVQDEQKEPEVDAAQHHPHDMRHLCDQDE